MTPIADEIAEIEPDDARRWFESTIASRLEPLHRYADALTNLAYPPAPGRAARRPILTSNDVESLNSRVEDLVTDYAPIIGAGFIAGPGIVEGADRYMLWLQRRNGAIRRLRLNFDISDLDAYDYVGMDWYIRACDRLQPSMTGPYLDYSGSDALVLTASIPVVVGDRIIGVVAVDLMAQAVEELMTTHLCRMRGEVVVVNQERAVISTNSVRWMPGERLPAMPSDDPDGFVRVTEIDQWTQWQLAVLRSD